LGEWEVLLEVARREGRDDWFEVLELLEFSVWQNVRISTLVQIKFNDFFFESGGIWLAFVKWHRGPVWTILHPIAERIAKSRWQERPNGFLIGEFTEASLGKLLEELCSAAGVAMKTWHDTKHCTVQYMNHLGYLNLIMQVLGMWKDCHSMKYYIRERGRRWSLGKRQSKSIKATWPSSLKDFGECRGRWGKKKKKSRK
jgi:hypothetical protein